MDEHMDIEADSPQSHTSAATNIPLKIRKKPGRKPNPASPAVRKAQNRAAQRAFRERKEQRMKEMEVDTKRLIQEREQYYNESQRLTKENDILKCENWYLKGIVLSLQMVCFKSKLRIPRHVPHIDDRARQIMSNTVPPTIAAHLTSDDGDSQQQQKQQQPTTAASPLSNSNNSNSGGDQHRSETDHRRSSSSRSQSNMATTNQESSGDSITSSNHGDTTEGEDIQSTQPVMLNSHTEDAAVSNNMAAIQALRFRLRIQSALFRENTPTTHSAKPSPLQLAVPHDPRIDLIPTVHMRDRMILFRDQFDLDDCLRLLINEAVFHGGEVSMAKNWELPAVFFEKYWYLTTDYTMERTSQRWRQIKNMFNNDPTLAPSPPPPQHTSLHPSPSTASLSPNPSFNASNDMEPSEETQRQQLSQDHNDPSYYQQHQPAHHQQQQQQYWSPSEPFDRQNNNNNNMNVTNSQKQHYASTITTTTNNSNSALVHHHPAPQSSSLVPTDNDILALMTPAPSAGVGPHYSPLQTHASPAMASSSSCSYSNVQHHPNYGILPNAPPPPPPSIPLTSSSMHQGDFVFQDHPVAMPQQQHIQDLTQQEQLQQQQHASQPSWNQAYSFVGFL